jgi:hypothetical protein
MFWADIPSPVSHLEGTESSQTRRWREPDSNFWSLSGLGAACAGQMTGNACGALSQRPLSQSGTEGSNPACSAGESIASLTSFAFAKPSLPTCVM